MAIEKTEGHSFVTAALTELSNVLAELADSGATAKIVYATLLEELLVRFEQTPNGSQLADLVASFNRDRATGLSRLPLGTAGTAAEAVSIFRNKLAKGYRTRLPLNEVSPDLAHRVGGLFDEIVLELRDVLSEKSTADLAQARALHQQQMAEMVGAHEVDAQRWRDQSQELSQQLEDAIASETRMHQVCAQKDERIADLVRQLDSTQLRCQGAISNEAVAREKVSYLTEKVVGLEKANASLTTAEATERKSRLLTLDSNRQIALELASTQEQHQALKQRLQDLEGRAREDLARYEQVQAGNAALLARCAELERSVVVMATATARKPAKPRAKSSKG